MRRKLEPWIKYLQNFTDQWWYAPVIAVLAGLDLFILIVPTDGLLISACMLTPRRWLTSALIISLGSALGVLLLSRFLQKEGLPFLLKFKPDLVQSSAWIWTVKLMAQWGPITVFLMAISPLIQHPAVAMAAIGGMPIAQIVIYAFFGRFLKYLFLAWLASHAPKALHGLWGIQHSIKRVFKRWN